MGNELEKFDGEECFNNDYRFSRKGIGKEYHCSIAEQGRKVDCKYFKKEGNICHAYNQTEKEIKENKIYNNLAGLINIDGPLQKEGSFLDEDC